MVYATEEVIGAARADDREAVASMRTYAGWLAEGIAIMVHLLDPELVVPSGGLTENNPLLLECLRMEFSQLGYHGAVFGAAGLARERLRS